MPTVWRLVKTRYSRTAFDGEGARLYGGRWSSPGTPVAYGSESLAVAVLEVLVHLGNSDTLHSYSVVSADLPDDLVTILEPDKVPSNWKRSPAPAEAQAIGDAWVRKRRSVGLRVPSVILEGAYNYLLNPAHPGFADVKVSPPRKFDLDTRLVRRK